MFKQFYFKQFNLACHLLARSQTVLFDPQIRPYQMLPLRVKMDLGAMAMKGYSIFPKCPRLLPHYQIVLCHIRTLVEGSYPSAGMQSVYSKAPADWAVYIYIYIK